MLRVRFIRTSVKRQVERFFQDTVTFVTDKRASYAYFDERIVKAGVYQSQNKIRRLYRIA